MGKSGGMGCGIRGRDGFGRPSGIMIYLEVQSYEDIYWGVKAPLESSMSSP